MKRWRWAFDAVRVLGVSVFLFTASNAFAYCPTTTCVRQRDFPDECEPGLLEGVCQRAGKPLYWDKPCTSFSVQVDGSKKFGITADQLQALGRTAFDNWLNVDCPTGGRPNFSVETYPQVECDEARHNVVARNQNVWVFRDTMWIDDDSAVALTGVSFDPSTGEIFDADIVFNSDIYAFHIGSGVQGYDLRAVIQHETGHILGLAHSNVATATMRTTYDVTVDMSSLDPDDIEGACAVFPPVTLPVTSCDAEPDNGFSTHCDEALDEGCSCSIAGKPSNGRRGAFFVAIVWAFVFCGRIKRSQLQNRNGRLVHFFNRMASHLARHFAF